MAGGSIVDNGKLSGRRGRFLRGVIPRSVLDEFNEKGLRVRTRELFVYDDLGGGR